jgi:hypothetical protein
MWINIVMLSVNRARGIKEERGMDSTSKKIDEFFALLEQRTINSIDANLPIKESCTATLLLIFAVIDSLSKITCDETQYAPFLKNRRGDRDRFLNFLQNDMRHSYATFKEQLYDLRCDVVHTGINAKVILSKDIHASHLEEVDGHLWINTSQFLDDLKETVREIRRKIEAKGTYFQNAENRLKELDIIDVDPKEPIPSPGPAGGPF